MAEPGTADVDHQRAVRRNSPSRVPEVSAFVLRWFTWYSRRYVRRQFHGLRVAREDWPTDDPARPLVIFLNHASWWDPLTVLLVTQHLFPQRRFYAPIDAVALQRYGILEKIGMFGVEQGTARGARQFLATSSEVLGTPGSGLCVTPQGRFADVRERPVTFAAGLGMLARRFPEATFLPMSVEYCFWEERLPEILVKFGRPVGITNSDLATSRLQAAMEATQEELKLLSLQRQPDAFSNLLAGQVGVGGVYDRWRAMRSWLKGERFRPEHSTL